MYQQIDSNIRLTWALLGLFCVGVIALGWVFARIFDAPGFLFVAVLIAFFQAFISYYYSDKIALATVGAKVTKREDYPELYRIVENLCIAAGLPQPRIYVIDDESPNAFATGRDPKRAALAVTTGLLKKLNKVELEGVVSHELAHIGNYDIRLMTIVVVLVGVIALLADWGMRMAFWGGGGRGRNSGYVTLVALALWILAPLSATLVQLAISRRREYLADATGALVTRYPEGLAAALEKIAAEAPTRRLRNRALSHLFIADPYKGDKKEPKRPSRLAVLFSTHPPIPERARRLRDMTS